jgi:spore coat protein A
MLLLILTAFLLLFMVGSPVKAQSLLDPLSLTKYVDPLPIPGVATMAGRTTTKSAPTRSSNAFTARCRSPPCTVRHVRGHRELSRTDDRGPEGRAALDPVDQPSAMTHILDYAIDPTLPRAMTTTGVPIATHVHGAEVEPQSDGGPYTWFTADFAEKGPDWTQEVHHYANTQLPATIWYHDHAFGYTRHNVYAGLAGYYLLTDPETSRRDCRRRLRHGHRHPGPHVYRGWPALVPERR